MPAGVQVYDVSSYADEPYRRLSPMYAHGGIPVPGMARMTSDSVEGIWQGLKVIRGKTAPRYFHGKGHKRGGKPAGHQYGDKLIGLVEARFKIYCPAYEWMLANRIDPALLESFIDRAFAARPNASTTWETTATSTTRLRGWRTPASWCNTSTGCAKRGRRENAGWPSPFLGVLERLAQPLLRLVAPVAAPQFEEH